MDTEQTNCKLKSMYDDAVLIDLPHNQPVILGRIEEQKIADISCSRNQLEVTADTKLQKITVKRIGNGKSSINGVALKKDEVVVISNDEIIEVVPEKYSFKVIFSNANIKQNDDNFSKLNDNATLITVTNCDGSKRSLLQSSTNQKGNVITAFLKQSTLPKLGDWEDIDKGKLLIFTSVGIESKAKIAGYDLDGTLIATKSGNVYPKDKFDWKILFPEVISKLKQQSSDFKIVIFTNQGGIFKGKTKAVDFKWKIEQIVRYLNVPVQVFVACSSSIYRKPVNEMWNYLVQRKNDAVPIDISESYFCGDAAGRPICPEMKKKKKDFAASDRLFAMNIGLKFYTPEEHFLNHKALPYVLPDFNPAVEIAAKNNSLPANITIVDKQNKEIIVMVGSPGSGKTHFANKYLLPENYIHVNRDTLGSWQKCVALVEKSILSGKSVVVDNTNPDKESRARYVEIAKKHSVKIRAFLMNLTPEHVKHNNKFRELTDPSHVPVPVTAINGYHAKYEEPALDEGFEEIIRVNFIPSFSSAEQEKLYSLYLCES